jgi:DNA processing protein
MRARSMTAERLSAWLALTRGPGLAPATIRLLVSAFGDVQALLAQPPHELASPAGHDIAQAVAAAARADVGEQVERTLAWCALPGNALVALDDPAYPGALLTMHDPPPLLYVSGQLECLHAPGVAIVGSRNATPQGLDDAARFARELAGSGLVVVSGLALGVDCAAHRGALEAGGVTVAVVGTGADIVYPAKHRALAHDITARGALVSEWPLGTPAKPPHFPQRNRLIAGMTKGVLVVEAALRSGSLITARLANEMGRDVFAIPGSIHAPLSRGCHQLIKDGAMLTETPQDVLEALGGAAASARGAEAPAADGQKVRLGMRPSRPARAGLTHAAAEATLAPLPPPKAPKRPLSPNLPLFETPRASPSPPALSAAADRLLDALGHAPAALEILAARTEMGSAALQGALLELELRGHVVALPGGRYVRLSRG